MYHLVVNQSGDMSLPSWDAGVFYLMRPLGAKRVAHLLVILALSVGGAILLFYYQVEFAARLHCPKKVITVPRRYNHYMPW